MIYINGRFLTQKITGVNRLAYELCNALYLNKVEFTIIAPKHILSDYNISNFRIILWGIGSSHFWEQFCLPTFFLFKKKYLLFNFSGLGPILIKNQFITIHDMSILRHPEWFSKKYSYYYKIFYPIIVRRALQILTISEFSRKEIVDCLNIEKNKISVIYCGVSNKFTNKEHNVCNSLDYEYVLAVSSIDPRKNFSRLLSAVNLLNSNTKLVIIGNKNKVFQNVGLNLSKRVVFLGHVSDEKLHKYYSNAKLFIFPSVYEGFGLPPLEAMAMGCPTIVSDIEVFHEVFGDATRYFNPYDINDIANCIHSVLNSDSIRTDLINQGYKKAQKFNWEESAHTLMGIANKYI